MEKIDLNPCPFCGCEAVLSDSEGGEWYISCSDAECNTTMGDSMKWHDENFNAKADVIEKWNWRVV